MSSIFGGNKKGPSVPVIQPLPEPPKVSTAEDDAKNKAKARKSATTKTIYTSPLGMVDNAQTIRKTLLGQ